MTAPSTTAVFILCYDTRMPITPAQTSQELTEQLLNEFANRKRKAKGVPLSKGTGVEYNAELQRIIREIKKDINERLVPLVRKLAPEYSLDSMAVTYTRDTWVDEIVAMMRSITAKWTSPEFDLVAAEIATNFVRSADRVNRERFGADMRRFGIDIFGDNPELLNYVEASIFDNTRLITTIPEQYLSQVESIVMTNVRAGGRPEAITKLLSQQFGVSQRRAKMIARDQTAKVNGDIAAKRQQSSGFEYFQWIDSDDERVRDRHEDIANRVTAYGKGIYRWDNPPLSDRGTPIIPGQDFQCRCIARPVLTSEVEANQAAGRVRPGVRR